MEKVLGKIKSITFGIGGYNDAMLGYDIEFSLDGGSRGTFISNGFFDFNRVKHTEHCKWSLQDREDAAVIMLKDLSDILAKAKVLTVDKLVNIPVEVSIDRNSIKSWRVLEEVL